MLYLVRFSTGKKKDIEVIVSASSGYNAAVKASKHVELSFPILSIAKVGEAFRLGGTR